MTEHATNQHATNDPTPTARREAERLHFMGIGGVGMSGLARWFAADGARVSGCDAADGEALAPLRAAGIEIAVGHDPAHAGTADRLVHTMAVSREHPELAAARAAGVRTSARIELLAEVFARRRALAVTGTHGKSTTTGMLATILLAHGDDPSVLLGATLPPLGGNARYGRGPYVVAEVDESDPGFAALAADVAVLTNLEDDHVAGEYDERRNYHASLEELQAAARRFASQAREVLYCADWPALRELVAGMPALSYGIDESADYRLEGLELLPAGSRFALRAPDGERAEVRLAVPGTYNAQNAAAALAAAHLAGVPLAAAAEALASFRGVGRRWQLWGEVRGALIVDDYAHHPTEVEATLRAARHTGRRVRAVLQPHRWVRTARLWPALADAASLADEVLVLDVYSAGETPIAGVGSQRIVDRLTAAGHRARHDTHDSAAAYLEASLEENDLVITLGAGDVWRVAARLARGVTGGR